MNEQDVTDHSTLGWVRKELDATLQQAVDALEAYAAERDDPTQLQFCLTHLHQVRGILQMLELFGPSMLVEEAERLAQFLLDEQSVGGDEALETLMRAILQVPDYLERIQSGGQDLPILILPLLNDLRAARGESLLTESALFSPNLEARRPVPRAVASDSDLVMTARRLRHRYQVALLGYLREQQVSENLQQMQDILDRLDQAARDDETGTVWWVGGGLVEALREGGLESSTATKMLLGQIDRQMKRVIVGGEEALMVEPPRELIKNLLYYVGRAEPVGERVSAIQEQYALKDLLLDDEQIAQARAGVFGPSNEILSTVAAAIKEDIAAVKDALDLFVRSGSQDTERLAALPATMGRIADTLGVLGLGVPRSVVKEQIDNVQAIIAGERTSNEQVLMDIAEALLVVESALDSLSGGGRDEWIFSEEPEIDALRPAPDELRDSEYRRVFGAAINEAIADINRVKEAVVKFIDKGEPGDLDGVPPAFHSVAGVLGLLGLERAAAVVRAAERYLTERMVAQGQVPQGEDLDRLADAVTGIEYYLEAVRDGRAEPERILDVSTASLESLGYKPESEPSPEDGQHSVTAADNPLPDIPPAEPVSEPVASSDAAPAPPSRSRALQYDLPVLAAEIDDDILQVFLEEAEELLQTINEQYPRWRADPEARDALITVRRMFHTIKGSGRLAGALQLGELAWAAESLLNGVIDNTIEPTPALYQCVDQIVATLPAMLGQIQGGPAPEEDIQALMRRAELLRDQAGTAQAASDALAAELQSAPPSALATALPLEFDEDGELDFALPDTELADIELEAEAETDVELAADPPDFGLDLAGLEFEALELEALELDGGDVAEIELEGIEEEGPEDELSDLELLEFGDFEIEKLVSEGASGDAELMEDTLGEMPALEPLAAETGALADIELQPDEADAGLAADPVPHLDPVLYQIFKRESGGHLATVSEFLDDCGPQGQGAVTEELLRALHTLTGSARMADVDPIARLGRALELYLGQLAEAGQLLDEVDLDLLRRATDKVEEILLALADTRQPLPDVDALLAEVAARPLPERQEITGGELRFMGEELDAVSPAHPTELESASPEPVLEIDPDLVELFLEEAEDILRFLDSTIERWEEAPDHGPTVAELHRSLHTLKGGARLAGFIPIANLCHALEGLTKDVAEHRLPADDVMFNAVHGALDRLAVMVAQAREGRALTEAEELIAAIAELRGSSASAQPMSELEAPADIELLDVFLEEAAEILDTTENILHRWSESPHHRELITELQRALHTLKGGARMAGLLPVGNLSHALETLLIDVLEGKLQPSPALFELLEQVHDRLYALRELAAQGEALPDPHDLLTALAGAREGMLPSSPMAEAASAAAADDRAGSASGTDAVLASPPAPAMPVAEQEIERVSTAGNPDVVRVRADLLDTLVGQAGEINIYRARLEQQIGAMRFNLTELNQTVERLREQLRTLEIETETQILYRFEREHEGDAREDFDPLELDRFSHIQELSRALSESVNDLVSIEGLLDHLAREAETLLLQQSRINTDLQDGLMRARMVPFANLVPRLRRIVRQTAQELGKQAQLKVLGAQGEMDRTVLERVIAPLEHMLRNAVAHGIELPERRAQLNKPIDGTVTVAFAREGADVVIRVSDDGAGIDLEAIRNKAIALGLMAADASLSDREVMQLILESGLSTAERVTQIAGRGVGMDVVNAEIKQLGGALDIDSKPGQGSHFTIRLPFTLAINQALLCLAGEEAYAIPLSGIEGVVRVTHEQLEQYLAAPEAAFYDYGGQRFEVRSLARLLGVGEPMLPGPGKRAPLVLVHASDHRLALQVDGLIGSREIVVKSVGPQISTVPGIFGATILADGRVVLILDVAALVRADAAVSVAAAEPATEAVSAGDKPLIMVVDDSITMRKVAARLLERNGMSVITAKDGVDAVALLQERVPDAMLLDIEMPRMDGYELATHMRNEESLRRVPIIMITSRTGEKHRQRAMEIGVNRYLGKPYQESDLLSNLREVLEENGRGA